MAKAAAAKTAQKAKGKGGFAKALPWYGGLACGFLFAISLPTAVLLAVTLAPAVLVAAFDQEAGRFAARPTALFSSMVTIPMLPPLWASNHSVGAALRVITDIDMLLLVALSGFVGYALARVVPIAAAVTLEKKAQEQAGLIRERLAKIREDWDDIEG